MTLRGKALSIVLVAGLLPAGLSMPGHASSEAPGRLELCFGQVPTIVGAPGDEEVVGTKGSDVIVTNGADEVDARDGDDLVCVTGDAPDYGAIVLLGAGTDQLMGNPSEGEIVYANDEAPGEADRDTIDTGGGSDTVVTGGEVAGAGVGEDLVALGGGRDLLKVTGDLSAATLEGGPGRDEIFLWARRPRGVAVTIDNRREELLLGGEVVMGWSSFDVFTALGIIEGPFTFRGTSLPETVGDGVFFVGDRWKVDVRMGGGRDRVLATGGAQGSRFGGGRGADVLRNDGSSGAVIFGRAGNDRLIGDEGNDRLVGGRGYDRADGGGGFDRCKAELRTRCES